MIACGVPPWFMVAHSAGESFPGLRDATASLPTAQTAPRVPSTVSIAGFPSSAPGRGGLRSLRSHGRTATRPVRCSRAGCRSGPISTEPLKEVVRRMCSDGWAPHPGFWAIAVDYRTGTRVALGSAQSAARRLPDAVAASCAVPGSSAQSRLTAAATSTAACTRHRTSICSRMRARPGCRPQPALLDDRERAAIAWGGPRLRDAPAGGTPAAQLRSAACRKAGTEVLVIQPTARRPRCDGHEPDEPRPPQRGHRDGGRDDHRAAALNRAGATPVAAAAGSHQSSCAARAAPASRWPDFRELAGSLARGSPRLRPREARPSQRHIRPERIAGRRSGDAQWQGPRRRSAQSLRTNAFSQVIGRLRG